MEEGNQKKDRETTNTTGTSSGPTSSTKPSDISIALTPTKGDFLLASNWVWSYKWEPQTVKDGGEEKEKKKKELVEKKEEVSNEKDNRIQVVEKKDTETENNNNNDNNTEKQKDNDHTATNITTTETTNDTTTMSSSKSKPVTNQESKWVESNSDLASFSTVNGFWSIYEKVLRPSMCPKESEGKKKFGYFVFREGFEPMYESPSNEGGGYWQIYARDLDHLDQLWEDILLAMIGESLEQSVYTEEELANMKRREVEEGIPWIEQIDKFIHGLGM